MGRQPNIRLRAAERPIDPLDRGPERRWTPTRPGEITSPADTPSGGSFGRPGPDTGWGLRMVAAAPFDRGRRPGDLERLLAALVGARASMARRGPTAEDVEVALSLAGLHDAYAEGGGAPERLTGVREHWLDEMAHDPWPGRSALDAIPADLLLSRPEEVRARLRADPSLVG